MKMGRLVHATIGASVASALLMFGLYGVTEALDIPDVFDFLAFDVGLNFILLLMGIPVFLGWIRRREDRARLSELECMILDAIAGRLTHDTRDVWDQQIAAIRKVDRSPDGVKVKFTMRGTGRNPYLPLPALPNQKKFELASVRLMHPGRDGPAGAKVWCESGRLSFIEYTEGWQCPIADETRVTGGWSVDVSQIDDLGMEH